MKRAFEQVKEEFIKNADGLRKMPVRATKHSAGYDFYSPIDVTIEPKAMQMIWTDIKASMNTGEVLLLCVTSGMGKYGIMLANTLGVIDADYYGNTGNDGNIGFRLYNFSDTPYVIKAGDKIGQGIFTTFLTIDDEAEVNVERVGGFGSTNK
jgi:dUTP pyrophosphatase